jgi:outer membrane protein assembly factor BamB
LRVLAADGKVDAQPLYVAGLPVPGRGQRNALFVATEHDSVFAYDADRGDLLWQTSLLASGELPANVRHCFQVTPELGITATPVIDRTAGANGTLYVVGASISALIAGKISHRIHALDLASGVDIVPPVTITGTYPGTGDNSTDGSVLFDPDQYKERASLLLLDGVIYLTWASQCDNRPYTGWIMGYDQHTLAQVVVFNITPNGNGGGIWMSGAGLAADAQSNIYLLAGNGTFDTVLDASGFPSQRNFGNTFLKLALAGSALSVVDYFAPFNTLEENEIDLDLGSGGALVLPDMLDATGAVRQLAVGAGKDQHIYLVDRSDLGKFNPNNNGGIYQEIPDALKGGIFSMPAYFNGSVYFGAVNDHIKTFPLVNARLSAPSSESPGAFPYPGATPSISANGSADGIVWVTENSASAVLHAYAATNLAVELYNSAQATGGRDAFGAGNKFITPTIASARVFVGTQTGVGVFGLLTQETLSPLQKWRDDHFQNPSNVGAGADGATPAKDGVPNLVKYALGLDPHQSLTDGQLPQAGLTNVDAERYLTLTINRPGPTPEVKLQAQVSTDAQTWTSAASDTVVAEDSPTRLVIRDNTPMSAAARRFMRLVITKLSSAPQAP